MLSKSSIKIYARVKPSTEAVNYYDIGGKDGRHESLIIHTASKVKRDGNPPTHSFTFQKVFTEFADQAELFDIVGRPVVQAVFSGYNGAILAYGQTGTGKTHSISGGTSASTRGMIPRAFQKIFDMIVADQANNSPREFAVAMSTLEIYNEQCIDLLSKDASGPEEKFRVELREDAAGNVRLRNLREYPVRNMQEVEKYMFQSLTNRVTADTPMNQHSSRSHCIFTLYLRQRVNGERKQVKSKLHMIDLSGSERVWKNRISGHLLCEAKHINLSLHYLEQVIIALNDPKRSHVPYRNSSITNFLRDSLGGNSRTAMVFTISLEPNNFNETLSTCRFSQRVSLVKNHMKKVIEYDKDEELDFLRFEVERLKRIISEMIGEDQMRLRLSASEESVPSKRDAPLWIKSSSDTRVGQLASECQQTAREPIAGEGGSMKRHSSETMVGAPNSTVRQNVQPEMESPEAGGESRCSGSSWSSSADESDRGTKRSRKSNVSSVSSTYLDEVYGLLTNDDPITSDLLNINKLLTVIGLELPYSDRNTGRRFEESDREEFKRYLELPQNREVLKVYVRVSIMFQRHVQNEKVLLEKGAAKHKAITEASAKIQTSSDKDEEDPESALVLKNQKVIQEAKYRKFVKSLLKSKKKRFHYIKLFTQTRLLLAEAFQGWRTKRKEERRTAHPSIPNIEQEKARLGRWVDSLRSPYATLDENNEFIEFNRSLDNKDMERHSGYNGRSVEENDSTSVYEDDQENSNALFNEIRRLNQWAWDLRFNPCTIPEPDVNGLPRTFSSMNPAKVNMGKVGGDTCKVLL